MMKLNINGKEYKIKFGYNSFCDTDLMDRIRALTALFEDNNIETDDDARTFGMIKDLFSIVRELIYVGSQKYNPIESEQEVGDLLDDYRDEGEEQDEDRGIMSLFNALSEELFNEGFLADLMGESQTQMRDGAKAPADHKTAKK